MVIINDKSKQIKSYWWSYWTSIYYW